MSVRLMFIEVVPLRSLEDFSVYDKTCQSIGNVVEGNWDNLCSAGISIMQVYDTAFGNFKTYTEETVREGVSILRAADLVIGFNLRNFAYPVLLEYSTYGLQHLPTFDLQAEIQWLRAKRANVRLPEQNGRIPFISLTNIAKYTCGNTIYPSGREMPRLWGEGKHQRVIDFATERIRAIQAIFNHGCRHGAVSYKQAGNKEMDPVILQTPMWKHKARGMVDSVVPKRYLEENKHTHAPAPERMFAMPNPRKQ